MYRLLPSFRQSLQQAISIGLLVGLALISATAFGQSAADRPKQLMTVKNNVNRQQPMHSQTEFIYQGQLRERGIPASGTYDIRFTLYSSQTGGNELGAIGHEDIAVPNGQFSVKLDFDRIATDSKELWLEIAMRHGSSTDAHTTLSPRQRLTSTPYAILAQQESWSLIGVPIGFDEEMIKSIAIDPLRGESGIERTKAKKDEMPGEEKMTAAAALGLPNFVVKFDAAGNPAAHSIMFDNGASVGVGTTIPKGKFHIAGVPPFNANNGQLTISDTSGNYSMILGRTNSYGFVQSHDRDPLALNPLGNKVGIGTTNPNFQLSLGSSVANTKLALYETGASNSYGLGVTPGTFRLHLNGAEARFSFLDDDTDNANELMAIQGSGDVRIAGRTRTGVLEIIGGSDLAEPFAIGDAEMINPGMVVKIDPAQPGHLQLANRAYDRTVAGIVSGANGIKPGLTMKQEGTVADGSLLVALTGRVYCWADASYGSIKPGDLLTSSNTPGHARKATNPTKAHGAIIGKAMTGLKSGKGLVLVLVTLQ